VAARQTAQPRDPETGRFVKVQRPVRLSAASLMRLLYHTVPLHPSAPENVLELPKHAPDVIDVEML
jgi:hypothetical protein